MTESGVAEFREQDLSGAQFTLVDLTGADFRSVDLSRVVMRSVDLIDARINGDIDGLVINGVEVAPLIEAELDRRHPERAKLRPTDPAGFAVAWDVIERIWAGTEARARELPPGLLHESVGGEWSFIETLRHLLFATDAWVRRAILGEPSPWHPLDLPWDEMPDKPGVPRDRAARPGLDEVLELRRDRMATVRAVIDGLTGETLGGMTTPVPGDSWPPSRELPVRECLLVVLNEEWWHNRFAERDLEVLVGRGA